MGYVKRIYERVVLYILSFRVGFMSLEFREGSGLKL